MLAHNAPLMSRDGSEPASAVAPLPPLLAPVVVLAGIGAMLAAAPRAATLGLRPGLVLSELALLAPGMLAFWLLRRPLRLLLGGTFTSGRAWLLAMGCGATLWVASLGLFELQYSIWAPPDGYLEMFRLLHERLRPRGPLDALVSLLAIAIAPALCEELLFRGLLLPSLLRAVGTAAAIVASAVLFGLIHLDATPSGAPSLYRVPFAIFVGLGLAILRLVSGGLQAPALAHATLNAITFLAAPFADDPAAGLPDPRPWLGAAMLAGGLGLLALVMRPLGRRRARGTPAGEPA